MKYADYRGLNNLVFFLAIIPIAFSSNPVSELKSWWSGFDINSKPQISNSNRQPLSLIKPKSVESFLLVIPKSIKSISDRIVYETDVFAESLFYISEQVQSLSDKNADHIAKSINTAADQTALSLIPVKKIVDQLISDAQIKVSAPTSTPVPAVISAPLDSTLKSTLIPAPSIPVASVPKLVSVPVQPVQTFVPSTPSNRSLDSGTLAIFKSEIDTLKSQFSNIGNQFKYVPTVWQLPPPNTQGIGNIPLNPKTITPETATISGTTTTGGLVVTGDAQIDGTTKLNGITYTWPGSDGSSSQFFQTDGSGALSWVTVRQATSNSLDFDELVDSLTLDANTTIASAGFTFTITDATTTIGSLVSHEAGNVGINSGGNIDTRFEVGGTASISGNITTLGTFTSTNTGSSSFSGSLDITKGLRVSGNITNDVLTTSRLVFSNGSKVLSSVSNLADWIAGTTNQVTVTDDTDGSVTLSLPQDIHTGASPQFTGMTLTGNLTGVNAEFQGTASASYGLFGALQVGGFSSTSYSRFGTGTISGPASNWITQSNDLLVSGDLYGVGTLSFQGPASLSNTMVIKNGNVGIGTTAPRAKLNIYTTGAAGNDLLDIRDNDYGASFVIKSLGVDRVHLKSASSGDVLSFGTANSDTELMLIDTSGKVGIGTTTPTSLLTVEGRGEFQGTASSSYLLTCNTLQVGGFSSAAYSRFGTGTTTHAGTISDSDDLLISGGLEVNGSAAFDGYALFGSDVSVSEDFDVSGTGSSSFLGSLDVSKGIHGLQDISATGRFLGYSTASNSFLGSLNISKSINANTYNGASLQTCDATTGKLAWNAGKFSCATDADTATAAAGETGEIQFNNSDAFAASTRFFWDNTRNRLGIGGTFSTTVLPATTLEVQGTASASYLLTGNTLQVGGFSSAAYSRFGTGTTTSSFLTGSNDLLITGKLEVDSDAHFD